MKRLPSLLAAAVALSLTASAPGVIILGSGDPNANDTEFNPPSGALTNSGLQWVGRLYDTGAAVISPNHFISAEHLGIGDGPHPFVFQGVTYMTNGSFKVPGADLRVWRISGTFPTWAPLFSSPGAELGRHLVVFGAGTRRGAAYSFGGTQRGWLWGDIDGRLRWGENKVASLLDIGGFGQQIYGTFDAGSAGLGYHECHLSNRDSGGPVFIREGGVWKVAAVNFSVDGYFAEAATGGDFFIGAFTDCSGLYSDDGSGNRDFIPGPAPVPTGFYSTRISAYLNDIRTYIGNTDLRPTTFATWQSACFTATQLANASLSGPSADPDGDGLTNLEEFAFGSAPWMPSAESAPSLGTLNISGSDYLTVSYNRVAGLTGVTYVVEASSDLQTWQSGSGVTTLVSETPQAELVRVVVRDQTPVGGGRRYLRVRVSSP
ncbi:MAG: hypothetical protein JSR82_05015 [Verrucomicrobia bacterium]|nr:hypothetical protein [Verrucomicrobiota bacterium]